MAVYFVRTCLPSCKAFNNYDNQTMIISLLGELLVLAFTA